MGQVGGSQKRDRSSISPDDVEAAVRRLFTAADEDSDHGLVITVRGDEGGEGRADAFRELLESLALYDEQYKTPHEIRIEPPDKDALAAGLSTLGQPHLQKKLFHYILLTFGRAVVDPLGGLIADVTGGTLVHRMRDIRERLRDEVRELRLSSETQGILVGDLDRLLTDEYLEMLAEHEETVQRPRAGELAQEVLHLIGTAFHRAFQSWPANARRIAASVSRRIGARVALHESPVVIRDGIVKGIEEFLWTETSTEISGSLRQLFAQKRYQGLVGEPYPEVDRATYREFARACWDLIERNG
jgi:hypothetical protein